MADFTFKTSGGGEIKIASVDSDVLGQALKNKNGIVIGTVFKPATGADRDAFVAYLQGLDYTARSVRVTLSYDVTGEGLYTVQATRNDTQDELDAWIEQERGAMAKRLGLKDDADITVTIAEI